MSTGSDAASADLRRARAMDPDARGPVTTEARTETPACATPTTPKASPDSLSFAQIWQLFAYTVVDARGTRMGPITRVWTDVESGKLTFVGLTTGRFRRQTHVIPSGGARIDDNDRSIRVPYPAAAIRGAPHHNTDVSLTSDQERKVGTYYGNS